MAARCWADLPRLREIRVSGMARSSIAWVGQPLIAQDAILKTVINRHTSDDNLKWTNHESPRSRDRPGLRSGGGPEELHARRGGVGNDPVGGQPEAQAAGATSRPAPGRADAAGRPPVRRRRGLSRP